MVIYSRKAKEILEELKELPDLSKKSLGAMRGEYIADEYDGVRNVGKFTVKFTFFRGLRYTAIRPFVVQQKIDLMDASCRNELWNALKKIEPDIVVNYEDDD
jgi:hypothetical protein